MDLWHYNNLRFLPNKGNKISITGTITIGGTLPITEKKNSQNRKGPINPWHYHKVTIDSIAISNFTKETRTFTNSIRISVD